MTTTQQVLSPNLTATPPPPALATGYEVRFDDRQKLYRVWNLVAGSWAPRPGFASERVARAVADSLAAPLPRR